MKIRNVTNENGRAVPNQFVIVVEDNENYYAEYFQSYNSTIAKKIFVKGNRQVLLDEKYWDYSKTTGKYRNQFLGETKKETQAKIDSGEYVLTNLN